GGSGVAWASAGAGRDLRCDRLVGRTPDGFGAMENKRRVYWWRQAVGVAALALAVASADPAAAQRVRAGVLTCDISAGIGLILGSQKAVVCTFAPEPPGPQQVYSG